MGLSPGSLEPPPSAPLPLALRHKGRYSVSPWPQPHRGPSCLHVLGLTPRGGQLQAWAAPSTGRRGGRSQGQALWSLLAETRVTEWHAVDFCKSQAFLWLSWELTSID